MSMLCPFIELCSSEPRRPPPDTHPLAGRLPTTSQLLQSKRLPTRPPSGAPNASIFAGLLVLGLQPTPTPNVPERGHVMWQGEFLCRSSFPLGLLVCHRRAHDAPLREGTSTPFHLNVSAFILEEFAVQLQATLPIFVLDTSMCGCAWYVFVCGGGGGGLDHLVWEAARIPLKGAQSLFLCNRSKLSEMLCTGCLHL